MELYSAGNMLQNYMSMYCKLGGIVQIQAIICFKITGTHAVNHYMICEYFTGCVAVFKKILQSNRPNDTVFLQ